MKRWPRGSLRHCRLSAWKRRPGCCRRSPLRPSAPSASMRQASCLHSVQASLADAAADGGFSARRLRCVCGTRPAIARFQPPAHVRRIRVQRISRSHQPVHLPQRRRMDARHLCVSTNARGIDGRSDRRRCRRSGADADRASAGQQRTVEAIPAAVPQRSGHRHHHGARLARARVSRLAVVRARVASRHLRASSGPPGCWRWPASSSICSRSSRS